MADQGTGTREYTKSTSPELKTFQVELPLLVVGKINQVPIKDEVIPEDLPSDRVRSGKKKIRQVALGTLASLKEEPNRRVLEEQIKLLRESPGLDLTDDDVHFLVRQMRQGSTLERVFKGEVSLKLPDKIEANLLAKKPPKEKTPPLTDQVKSLNPRGYRLANLEESLPETSEEITPEQREEGIISQEEIHPAHRLMAKGVFAEDIEASLAAIEKAAEETGTTVPDDTRQRYQEMHQEMKTCEEINPDVVGTLRSFHSKARQLNQIPVKQIAENFNLPHLEALQKVPAFEKLTGISQTIARIDLSAGNLLQTGINLAKKIPGSKAVIAGVKKVGQQALKMGAKAASKLAAKAGIKLTASAIGAALPTGVTQAIAIFQAVSTALDVLEKVPVIGGLAKALKKVNPLKILKNVATLKYIRDAGKDGSPANLAKAGINALIVGAPLMIFAPITGIALVGLPLLLAGGYLLVAGLGPAIASGAGAAFTFTSGTIFTFLAALPALPLAIPIATIVIVFLVTVGIFTIFIVVLTAGGAFLVTPYEAPLPETGSAYIEVTKTVNGQQKIQIENPNNAVNLNYQITISSEQGASLANIQVSNSTTIKNPDTGGEYTISQDEDGNDITSWQFSQVPSDPITYTVRLHPDFISGVSNFSQIHDSWLTDTVTVTANVTNEGLTGESETATATVEIGDAPVMGPMGWPVSGCVSQGPFIAAPSHGNCNCIDITCNTLEPIHATHDGEAFGYGIGQDGPLSSAYGIYVIVYYPQRSNALYRTTYGHIFPGTLQFGPSGTQITAGTVVGRIGNTGHSSGAHLHYQLNGDPGLGMNINNYVDPDIPSSSFECGTLGCDPNRVRFWVTSSW